MAALSSLTQLTHVAALASLADPTHDALEAELIELGLLHYCQPALQRRRGGASD